MIENPSVSGKHAEIEISDDYQRLTLKDLDSSNGTRVNGRSILAKEISNSDQIIFGNVEVDSIELINNVNHYVKESRNDFHKEFQELKLIEETYLDKRNRLNKYYKIKTSLPKILLTLLVILVISFLDIDNDIRYIIIIVTGFLGTILTTISVSEKRKLSLLEDLRIEFQLSFVCPKCNKELSNNKWRYWKEKKTCPNCKCNWTK